MLFLFGNFVALNLQANFPPKKESSATLNMNESHPYL